MSGRGANLEAVTARLKDKVGSVLQETRILVLSSHVLLGFQLRAHFESGYAALPPSSKGLLAAALVLMVVGVTLLVAPLQYHRLAERGDDSRKMHHYTSKLLVASMGIFLFALLADLYVVAAKLMGPAKSSLMAASAAVLAAIPLFVIPAVQRVRRRTVIRKDKQMDHDAEPGHRVRTDVRTKISHLLTETRLVLPGAQALLGFQFITFLTDSFDRLPPPLRRLHLWSLVLVAISIVLLVAPAAYHRIAERGEETNHFYRYASRLVMLATIPLGLGISGDVYLVLWKVSESPALAGAVTATLLAMMLILWFIVPLLARHRRAEAAGRGRTPARAPGAQRIG